MSSGKLTSILFRYINPKYIFNAYAVANCSSYCIPLLLRYPTHNWEPLGTFMARDERGIQSFTVKDAPFAKYLRIEILSHYGTEHYCPLSTLRYALPRFILSYENLFFICCNAMFLYILSYNNLFFLCLNVIFPPFCFPY